MEIKSVLLLRVSSVIDKNVGHPQFFDPSYPLKYLQAGLKTDLNISIRILDCWIQPMTVAEMVAYIAGIKPDLMVISASSFDIQIADDLVSELQKQTRRPLVIGIGQGHYLNRNRPNQDGYDAILLGEPEQEFFKLLDRIRDSRPGDSAWREYYRKCYRESVRFVVDDPDSLPFPSYSSGELKAYRSIYPVQVPHRVVWGFLIATRGCPHGCVFCSEVMRVSIGKKIRSRSAPNVADEMQHLAEQGVSICSFQDDSFSTNRKFVQALTTELIARGSTMPWMARARVDELDYEMLSQMKAAGCIMLGLGVESGCQRIVEEMHKQPHPKPWRDQCRRVFLWTRTLGIGTNAYYVIGNPTETREEIEQTIEFALELNADSIQVHFYTPYPGSVAWEKYRDRISDEDSTRLFHYATPMLSLADVSVADLVKLRSKFYRRYLLRPGFVFDHLRKHASFYWHNPDVFRNLLGIRKIL